MASVRPSVIVFDVNETLLDLEALAPLFTRLFGHAELVREWFAQLILYSEAVTLADRYVPLGSLGAGVLTMLGSIHGVAVAEADIAELQHRMLTMPAHSDVADGLRRLRTAGFRLVTLTNSAPTAQGSPIDRAGIADLFDRAFSVHDVKRLKPAPECYRMVADAMEVTPGALCLVAAHMWDTLGAQAVGCAGAFVARPGNAVLPVEGVPQPDIVAPDLTGVVDAIIARWAVQA